MPGEEIFKDNLKEETKSNKEDNNISESSFQEVPKNEGKKSYLNLYFCNISVGIIITYIFVLCSISTNIINRIIFYKYEFEFEIFLLLLQEIFNILFYIIASNKSQIFRNFSGEISFRDFY